MAYSDAEIRRLIQSVERLNDSLEGRTDLSRETRDAQDELTSSTEAMGSATERTSTRTRALSNDMTLLTRAALDSDRAFENNRRGVLAYGAAAGKMVDGMGTMAGGIASLFSTTAGSAVKRLFGEVAGFIDEINGWTNAVSGFGLDMIKFFEGPLEPIKMLEQQLFTMEKAFGGSYAAARSFGEELLLMGSHAANEFFINPDDIRAMASAFSDSGISLDRLRGNADTAVGSLGNLELATLHASAIGMTMRDYVSNMSEAIKTQGKSFEQATLQMQMYSDIAKETGINISDIARSLQSGIQGFEKLGFAADFGRPMLEGFSETLSDMGMGFEQALTLSASLSNSLAGLSTNYAAAYITFQRGGIDMGGGGGVLGAGIGLQNRLLEAEDTGDQSRIGQVLAEGMRDTIAGMTGGQIVTSFEAEEGGPQAQQQFYMQSNLLQSMYGLDEQTSIRTLNLLDQLQDAQGSGNRDLVDSLNQQLQEEVQGRDASLTEQQKANAQLSGIAALNVVQNRLLYEQLSAGAVAGRRVALAGAEAGQEMAIAEYGNAARGAEYLVTMGEQLVGNIMESADDMVARNTNSRNLPDAEGATWDSMMATLGDLATTTGGRRAENADIEAMASQARESRRVEQRQAGEAKSTILIDFTPAAQELLRAGQIVTRAQNQSTGVFE